MDLFFEAISLYRRRKYDLCIEKCNALLQKNVFHQGPWELKMRAMTQRVYIDDIEANDGVVGRYSNMYVYIMLRSCKHLIHVSIAGHQYHQCVAYVRIGRSVYMKIYKKIIGVFGSRQVAGSLATIKEECLLLFKECVKPEKMGLEFRQIFSSLLQHSIRVYTHKDICICICVYMH